MAIINPLHNGSQVIKEASIPKRLIIDLYQKDLNINVEKFFAAVDDVEIYRCAVTGYRFYYPFNLAGDSDFYAQLQLLPWYYADWKDEYDQALPFLTSGEKLLEIGCGKGAFLTAAAQRGVSVAGLEMNSQIAAVCRQRGLAVAEETIEVHAETHGDYYDNVFSFQVVEHIAEIGYFLTAALAVLKPGGKLLISVPNNDSFFFKEAGLVSLNLPPHHMGLWGVNSLIALQKIFPLRLERLEFESLSLRHAGFAFNKAYQAWQAESKIKFGFLSPLVDFIASRFVGRGAELVAKHIPGHTITAIFTKR